MELQKRFIMINGVIFDKNVTITKYNRYIILGDKFHRLKLHYNYAEWKKPSQLTKTKNMLRYYFYEKI